MANVKPYADPSSPRAPWKIGSVPRSGWCCIETVFDHLTPCPKSVARVFGLTEGDAAQLHELATEETLQKLADAFARQEGAGRGLLITRDHASMNAAPETRAAGWIRALHREGPALWAWVEWTPWGHAMVNGGEFVHFSTEYDYAEFVRTPGGISPTRLTGCTLTNEPRHPLQTPCTNSKPNTMTEEPNTPPAEETPEAAPTVPEITAGAPGDEPQEPTAANNEPDPDEVHPDPDDQAENCDDPEREQTAANSDPAEGGLDLSAACQQAAAELDLPETATPADLLDAIRNLKKSNEELTAALAESNRTAAANSKVRYPHLVAANAARTPLTGGVPNDRVAVRTGNVARCIDSQAKSKADYCLNSVANAEKALGRRFTPREYSEQYARALKNYELGINR